MFGTNTINRILPLSVLGLAGLGITAQAAPKTGITVISARVKTLSASEAAHQPTTHGIISSNKKVLTFSQKAIRLVAVTGPDNDMLSYRIEGLRNPTLVVPAGATLKVFFINTDDDMMHSLRFTVQKPPFKGPVKSVGTINLAHKSMMAYHAEDLTMRVPTHAGTYNYLCTVPGHAPGGMYGTLIVR